MVRLTTTNVKTGLPLTRSIFSFEVEVISKTELPMQIMPIDARLSWEKLVIELKLLRNEDFGHLVPLCIGVQSVLWPTESAEACQRSLQFMGFEILKSCEGHDEAQRWEILRQ